MVWHSTPFSVPVGISTEPVPVVDPVVGLIAPLSAEHEAHAPVSKNVADIEMRTHHELTRILAECAGRRGAVVPSGCLPHSYQGRVFFRKFSADAGYPTNDASHCGKDTTARGHGGKGRQFSL